MPTRRRISIVTGSRSEYGLLRPVIEAVNAHQDLELQLIVTGAHLAKDFGSTVDEIRNDGFSIAAKVAAHPADDSGQSVARAVARGVDGIANTLVSLRSQCMVVLGDRFEILAAAVAATYVGVPIAHIHGGDVTQGGADEAARHAITKLAHLHFPATEQSARRIRQMGEEPWRIKVAGAPCLDTIRRYPSVSRRLIERPFDLKPDEPYFALAQHSVSTNAQAARRQIRETLRALRGFGRVVVAVYPNADAGGRAIIDELEKHKSQAWLRLRRSLRHEDFVNLVRHSSAIIGNSSAGIIESPALGVPAVNIGSRQEGRERAGNVIDAPHEHQAIARAIRRALSPAFQKRIKKIENPYGGGNAGKIIARRLATVDLDAELLQKKFINDR